MKNFGLGHPGAMHIVGPHGTQTPGALNLCPHQHSHSFSSIKFIIEENGLDRGDDVVVIGGDGILLTASNIDFTIDPKDFIPSLLLQEPSLLLVPVGGVRFG